MCSLEGWGASVDYLFDRLREMAKNKTDEELLQLDYIVTLNFEKDELKSLVVDATPEEEQAAIRLVPQLLRVARGGGVVALKDSPRVADSVTKYLENLERSGEVSPQSLMDYRGDFDQFVAILGDLQVADLKDHDHVNRLKETLYRLPPNVNKMPETRGKPIADILALGLPPQAPGTVRKKWARLISFISWLETEGLIDKNIDIARAKKPKAKAQSYEKFSNDVATLQRAGVSLELREALAGHASKSINRRVYGEQSSIAMLRDAMAKLDYGFHVTVFQTNPNHERVRQRGQAKQNRPS